MHHTKDGMPISKMVHQASALLRAKKASVALPIINKVLKIHPNHATALGIKTECLLQLGYLENAVKTASMNCENNPNDTSRRLLYRAYRDSKKYFDALETAKDAAFHSPQNTFFWEQLYEAIKNFEESSPKKQRGEEMAWVPSKTPMPTTISKSLIEDLINSTNILLKDSDYNGALIRALQICSIDPMGHLGPNILKKIISLEERRKNKK